MKFKTNHSPGPLEIHFEDGDWFILDANGRIIGAWRFYFLFFLDYRSQTGTSDFAYSLVYFVFFQALQMIKGRNHATQNKS